jgi:large subunit ribosomal protein L4
VRAQDQSVFVVDALAFDAPKTKAIVGLLEATGMLGNVLILTDGNNTNVHRSARNLPGVMVRPFGEESAYDLLWADMLLIEAPALERATEVAHA